MTPILLVLALASASAATCDEVGWCPSKVDISLSSPVDGTVEAPGWLSVRLWWNQPPTFPDGSAVEIEVLVYTNPEKCFGEPAGGIDDNVRYATLINFPVDSYTDVWNYSVPAHASEIYDGLEDACGVHNAAAAVGGELFPFDDPVANFAVGTRTPNLLCPGLWVPMR